MNVAKVTQIINEVIAENRNRIGAKAARKQYKPGVAQIAKLTELGIIDFMPAGYGFSDADAVIIAANEKATAVWFQGEGSDVPASDLNVAISEPKAEVKKVSTVTAEAIADAEHMIATLGDDYDTNWDDGYAD